MPSDRQHGLMLALWEWSRSIVVVVAYRRCVLLQTPQQCSRPESEVVPSRRLGSFLDKET